jgi:acetyl esterase/lipase
MPRETRTGNAVLYLHGGGYSFGSMANYRELGSRLALSCQARVLLPDYRLAPEHPHPAAVEDALACYQWLLGRNVPPDELAVAGDSAGGGLTLALLLRLKQEGLPLPAAAVCISPWGDLSCRGESYERLCEADPMLTRELLLGCAERYAAGQDIANPLISPVHGDFSGLPPLLIQVGGDEILLSDAERVYEAARAAGVDARLTVLEGLWHVVHLFATAVPEARTAIADIGRFLRLHAAGKQARGQSEC